MRTFQGKGTRLNSAWLVDDELVDYLGMPYKTIVLGNMLNSKPKTKRFQQLALNRPTSCRRTNNYTAYRNTCIESRCFKEGLSFIHKVKKNAKTDGKSLNLSPRNRGKDMQSEMKDKKFDDIEKLMEQIKPKEKRNLSQPILSIVDSFKTLEEKESGISMRKNEASRIRSKKRTLTAIRKREMPKIKECGEERISAWDSDLDQFSPFKTLTNNYE
jgi:hypothetical protein